MDKSYPIHSRTFSPIMFGYHYTLWLVVQVSHAYTSYPSPTSQGSVWSNLGGVVMSQNMHVMQTLCPDDANLLHQVYCILYPMYTITKEHMSLIMKKFGSVTILGERYGSKLEVRSIRSGHILASWPGNCGVEKDSFALTPGMVSYYFTHVAEINSQLVEHAFASVRWFQPTNERNHIGNPVQLWSSH